MNATDFKARCLDVMDEVRARRISVVITKRGVPVAQLSPVEGAPSSPIGFLAGTVLDDSGLLEPELDWETGNTDPLA